MPDTLYILLTIPAGLTIDQVADQPMGCFVGGALHDYWDIQALDLDSLPKYAGTGTGGSILANRISWFFNLKGPSMTIDTACSSSMTAMHLACQSIRCGETDSVRFFLAPSNLLSYSMN